MIFVKKREQSLLWPDVTHSVPLRRFNTVAHNTQVEIGVDIIPSAEPATHDTAGTPSASRRSLPAQVSNHEQHRRGENARATSSWDKADWAALKSSPTVVHLASLVRVLWPCLLVVHGLSRRFVLLTVVRRLCRPTRWTVCNLFFCGLCFVWCWRFIGLLPRLTQVRARLAFIFPPGLARFIWLIFLHDGYLTFDVFGSGLVVCGGTLAVFVHFI